MSSRVTASVLNSGAGWLKEATLFPQCELIGSEVDQMAPFQIE